MNRTYTLNEPVCTSFLCKQFETIIVSNLEILQHNQITSLKNYFLNRVRDNTFFNALVSTDKGYTPLNLSDNIISDIVEPNIPDTIANIKQGFTLKNWYNQKLIFRLLMHGLRNQIFSLRRRVLYLRYKIVLSIQEIIKTYICSLQSIIIGKCRICGTEGETIEHTISSCTVLAQSEYKKRHDIFAKIIHMNLAVKFNLLKNTQPHYS
jgi:hypothetical protein